MNESRTTPVRDKTAPLGALLIGVWKYSRTDKISSIVSLMKGTKPLSLDWQ
jgi:hypothetical protein